MYGMYRNWYVSECSLRVFGCYLRQNQLRSLRHHEPWLMKRTYRRCTAKSRACSMCNCSRTWNGYVVSQLLCLSKAEPLAWTFKVELDQTDSSLCTRLPANYALYSASADIHSICQYSQTALYRALDLTFRIQTQSCSKPPVIRFVELYWTLSTYPSLSFQGTLVKVSHRTLNLVLKPCSKLEIRCNMLSCFSVL